MPASMLWTDNRLTVAGSRAEVRRFEKDDWLRALGGRHCEILEYSPMRVTCQFQTEEPPLEALKIWSRQHPGVFLLEYDCQLSRLKGLAKACAGKLDHCQLSY